MFERAGNMTLRIQAPMERPLGELATSFRFTSRVSFEASCSFLVNEAHTLTLPAALLFSLPLAALSCSRYNKLPLMIAHL